MLEYLKQNMILVQIGRREPNQIGIDESPIEQIHLEARVFW